jgi:crotonobetainyl-CoA:carnitine CoA-transferase CaiB-like acyl-CoA transferase
LAAPAEINRPQGPNRERALCDHDARPQREAEVDAIVTLWTKERTKQEAMAQRSAVGVPAGAVLATQELIDESSFDERGILQKMTHGGRTMVMPTWPVRFDGVPNRIEPAPLLGERTLGCCPIGWSSTPTPSHS